MREGGLDSSLHTAEGLDILSHGVKLAHGRLQKVVGRTTLESTWCSEFIPWHCSHKLHRFAACLVAFPTHSLLPGVSPPLSFSDANRFIIQVLLSWGWSKHCWDEHPLLLQVQLSWRRV